MGPLPAAAFMPRLNPFWGTSVPNACLCTLPGRFIGGKTCIWSSCALQVEHLRNTCAPPGHHDASGPGPSVLSSSEGRWVAAVPPPPLLHGEGELMSARQPEPT